MPSAPVIDIRRHAHDASTTCREPEPDCPVSRLLPSRSNRGVNIRENSYTSHWVERSLRAPSAVLKWPVLAWSGASSSRTSGLLIRGSWVRVLLPEPFRMRRAVLFIAVALLTMRCAATAGEEERERRSAPNRTLARAIDDVARGGAADAFRVRVEWSRGGRMVSAEMYGSGAAIWNDERAFRVAPAEIGATAK